MRKRNEETEVLRHQVLNLAMLVRRLCAKFPRIATPEGNRCDSTVLQAMAYLKAQSLEGSPLREEERNNG